MEDRSPMDTDSKAEILTRLAHRRELIERSKNKIENSKTLVEQSNRLIRVAMGHEVDGEGNNHNDLLAPQSVIQSLSARASL
jgi:hypothetical protein